MIIKCKFDMHDRVRRGTYTGHITGIRVLQYDDRTEVFVTNDVSIGASTWVYEEECELISPAATEEKIDG
jgi:hypothetical protein